MSRSKLILLFAVVFAGGFWFVDAALDWAWFYADRNLTLTQLAFTDVPPHETYIRLVVAVAVLGFGGVAASMMESRERSAAELGNVNRVLRVLSDSNQALVRAGAEPELLSSICRVLVERGGYALAWVGIAEETPEKEIRPVAKFGTDSGYVDDLKLSWADNEAGRNPAGFAIRSGKPWVTQDFEADPLLLRWRNAAKRRGYRALASFPLRYRDKTLGNLNVYASERQFFAPGELQLLAELAADIGYGLNALRNRVLLEESTGALAESTEQLALAMQGAELAMWDLFPATNEVSYDAEWRAKLGLPASPQRLTLADIHARIHPEDEPQVTQRLAAHLDGEVPSFESRHRLRMKDGAWRWVSERGRVVHRDQSGRPLRVTGVIRDISDAYQRDEQLRMTQFSIARAPDAVLWVNSVGAIRFANEAAAELTGDPVEKICTAHVWDYDLEYTEARWPRFWREFRDKRVMRFESRYRDTAGAIIPVQISVSHSVYEGEDYCCAFIRDVSELKAAADTARYERDRARQYLEVASVMFVGLDTAGRIVLTNPRTSEVLEYSEAELLGHDWFELVIPEKRRESTRMLFDRMVQGDNLFGEQYENVVVTKSGQERLIYWHNSTLRGGDGRITGTLGCGHDVTEQRRLEAQLRQAQKVEAVGQLAGGVAHDLNNILTAVFGSVELVRGHLCDLRGDATAIRGDIDQIEAAAERAAALTRQLLTFSRRQPTQPRQVRVERIVAQIEPMLRRLMPESIELTVRPDAGGEAVLADPSQIEQIIMNLAVNARDAMKNGGRLEIVVEAHTLDESHTQSRRLTPGHYVLLGVSDSGEGIQDEHRERIFDPFFTTKPPGEGTGLGLATVQTIVGQLGGVIEFRTRARRGTRFDIWLPATPAEVAAPRTHAAQGLRGGDERILVCEDDENVRKLVVRTLQSNGYRVLAASDPTDALALAAREEALDLVLTDAVMPHMNGVELARRLRGIYPNVRTLLMSGYTMKPGLVAGSGDEIDGLLEKPFGAAKLLDSVRNVLDEQALATDVADDTHRG